MDEMMKKILANILNISMSTSLSDTFYQGVLQRLVSLGYVLKLDDAWVICFAAQKVENNINNYCNTTSLPHGLFNVAVDMVCGEFLFAKKETGQLELNDLDFSSAVTSIKEGDTQVNFGGTSDDDKFTSLLNSLMHSGKGELLCYRRIQW